MAERTRVISVVGSKNCGKTTLVVALAQEYGRKGHRVGTIKHGTHPATIDREGTDTWQHYHEGHAERALIEAPGSRVLFERAEAEADPITLVRRFMSGMDVVILEGFTSSDVPKVEVHRRESGQGLRFDPSLPNAAAWIALVSNDPSMDVPFPTFNFSDTAWLFAISRLAWNAALEVDT